MSVDSCHCCTILVGRVLVEPDQHTWRANIRLMFQLIATRRHSPLTFSSPRSRHCRYPITDLMMPNTGSGVCLRSPYSFLPRGVFSRYAIFCSAVAESGGDFGVAAKRCFQLT